MGQIEEIVSKIKSRGHWRIRFVPLGERTVQIKPLSNCIKVVEKATVSLRGWDYPYVAHIQEDRYEIHNDYCGLAIDWKVHKEYWRMYQSSQFVHLLALDEDWGDEGGDYAKYYPNKPGVILSVIGSFIYQLTEVFEFLSRLAESDLYASGVEVSISLINTKDRILTIGDPRRVDFGVRHAAQQAEINFQENFDAKTIMESPTSNAYSAIAHIYERFGYSNYSSEQIKSIQQELYQIHGVPMR